MSKSNLSHGPPFLRGRDGAFSVFPHCNLMQTAPRVQKDKMVLIIVVRVLEGWSGGCPHAACRLGRVSAGAYSVSFVSRLETVGVIERSAEWATVTVIAA